MYFDLNIPRQLDQPGFFEGKFPRWPEAEEKLHRNRMSQLSQEITAGIRLTLFKRYPLRKLAYGDLHPRPDEFPNGAVLLENCKLVTSYSWLALCAPSGENENPYKKAAICVPGKPRRLLDVPRPFTLPRVKANIAEENKLVDHNPAGRASLSPLFQALLYTWPDFDMRKVDVVADVEDLCKLWKFVLGPSSSEISWRMDLRTQQNTTMFSPFRTTHTRKQPSIIEHFVANCTSQERDLLDSLSHYRVVHYILGGIGFLVRFKSHYYDPILDPCEQDQTIPDWDRKVKPFPDWYEKGCFDVFENERIDEQTPASVALAWCGISNDPENIVMQQIPRLYFTQTKHLHVPRFVAGHHHQPTVGEVCKLVNCADYMKNWERKQQENLMKFVSLVKNISEVASENCPKVCAAVLANGELRMETDESYAEILRNAHLPQSPVAGPEMPYGGREVIEHLWRTIGEDSLPDSWRG